MLGRLIKSKRLSVYRSKHINTKAPKRMNFCGIINVLPSPYVIVKNAINALELGRRVGILHLFAPQAPKGSKFVACVTVLTGFNRARLFSVYEKTA